jgi:hypothetical protein
MCASSAAPAPESKPAVLPDGRTATVTGNPERWSQSPAEGPPSIACFQWALREFGGATPPALPVSLSLAGLRDAFLAAGLSAEIEPGESLEDLAQHVEFGRAVLAVVNAGTAWNTPDALENGEPDHPILVSAVARDAGTGQLLGVYARDPTRARAEFVPAEQLARAWLVPGGWMIAIGEG